MHVCIISTVITAALVLKHQAISIHSVIIHYIGPISYKKCYIPRDKLRLWNCIFEKNYTFVQELIYGD